LKFSCNFETNLCYFEAIPEGMNKLSFKLQLSMTNTLFLLRYVLGKFFWTRIRTDNKYLEYKPLLDHSLQSSKVKPINFSYINKLKIKINKTIHLGTHFAIK